MSLPVFDVRFVRAAINDLRVIARHLERTTGDIAGAVRRTREIRTFAMSMSALPYQGTRRDNVRPGLRTAATGQAVIAFDVQEKTRSVRLPGIFHGGQNYSTVLAARLAPEAHKIGERRKP